MSKNKVNINNFKYQKIEMSIRDFLMMYSKIDVQPVGQRPDIQVKLENKKSQGIINTILLGINLGEITIHQIKGGQFTYESIDGGHRKRYIKAFTDGLIRTVDGRYFSELSDEERDMFLNYKLAFVIYSDLTVFEIGYIFRVLNESTNVTHQERLNSYGNIPIANAIRETVRPVQGIDNKFHPLFEYSQRDVTSKKKYAMLNFDNSRLKTDERVARIFYRYYDGGGLGSANDTDLEDMYQAELSQNAVGKLTKKVTKQLNFINKIAEWRKRMNNGVGISQAEFSLYSRIWMYMEETYGTFKVNDHGEFYRAIAEAMAIFNMPFDRQPKELQEMSPFDSTKTRGQQFNNSLGEHRSRKVILETLMWMLGRVNMAELVTIKDKKRLFPREWREAKLAEQGFKCAITGKPLTLAEAEGAHIVAHANGGRTEYDNLAMIDAKINKEMGTMSIQQYKELMAAQSAA